VPEPSALSPAEIRVGLTAEFEREITPHDVLAFGNLSGDLNPLHIDQTYAESTNLGRPVVHGAFQVGLASAMVGMHLPGRSVFLVSTNARYQNPLYYPSRVSVRGEVTAWDRGALRGNVKVTIRALPSESITSEIQMGFILHGKSTRANPEQNKEATKQHDSTQKVVLLTGAAGGIASTLLAGLVNDFSLLALVHRQQISDDLQKAKNITQFRLSFSDEEWRTQLEKSLEGRNLYAVIHAAWPGVPAGGLLTGSPRALEQQLKFGVLHTIDLARVLADHVDSCIGGRFIALGSTYGSRQPRISMAAYSLAKTCLENTVRLLAPELAMKKITVNAVCPSLTAVGMNQQANERALLVEKAKVPLGRLCDVDDILGMVRYLLSPGSSFVSGQTIGLTGGQL
jgi:NAD(P)-dependent dehydrogenase (short-subunit alcohol dehydrogenase family)/acyl dehydratase